MPVETPLEEKAQDQGTLRKVVFWGGILVCLLPIISPPLALVLGIVLALTLGHPFPKANSKWTKILLQTAVVGLGFGINLQTVIEAGSSGIVLTLGTLLGTLAVGWGIGKLLGLDAKISHLIASGTAICGGSAIAAVGPVLGADEQEMSVSLGTIFVLNAVALLLFPWVGHVLHLSQHQFGLWAAIAIHDTSSVVGAAAKYGNTALQIATTVKLARALWIVPLTIATAMVISRRFLKPAIPLFILLFVVASILYTYVPIIATIAPGLVAVAKAMLRVTLFLIGAGLSLKMIQSVGLKPLLQGVLLWVLVSAVSLGCVLAF